MMNTIGHSRTFKKNAEYAWRIYKFQDEFEMVQFQKIFQSSFFCEAIKIISEGRAYSDTLDWLNSISDDDSWKELFVKSGDLVLITKENLLKKEDALKKYKHFSYKLKINKTQSIMETNQNVTDNKDNTRWSPEELALIWSGTPAEVGAIIGRTAGAVTYQRCAYKKAHPDFVVPDEAKIKTRPKNKSVKRGKYKKRTPAVQNNIPNKAVTFVSQSNTHNQVDLVSVLKEEYNKLNEKMNHVKGMIEIYGGKI